MPLWKHTSTEPLKNGIHVLVMETAMQSGHYSESQLTADEDPNALVVADNE